MQSGEKRSEERVVNRRRILFGVPEPINYGLIRNVSLEGVAFEADMVYAPRSVIRIIIPGTTGDVSIAGEVRWYMETDQGGDAGYRYEMGVRFTGCEERYRESLFRLVGELADRRTDIRFEKVFQIEFASPQEVLDQYTRNISRGGIFISSPRSPALNSIVLVTMVISDPAQRPIIRAEGRVSRIVDRETAARDGVPAGFGVQFIRFFGGGLETFYAYIERLRERAGQTG